MAEKVCLSRPRIGPGPKLGSIASRERIVGLEGGFTVLLTFLQEWLDYLCLKVLFG